MSKYIDHIFFINLDKREDRKKEFELEMHKMGWNAERFPGIYYPPPKGIVGCGKSHLEVLKLAKTRGYKNVLIFEDDFVFLESKEKVEQELEKFFTNIPDFKVCMLAFNLHSGLVDIKNLYITKVRKAATASGYIVNHTSYDELINLYEENLPLLESTMQHWIYANDQIWNKLQEKGGWYCFTNRLGKQRDGFSDNANSYFNYDC